MLKITQLKLEKEKDHSKWQVKRCYMVENPDQLRTLFCAMIFPFVNFKDTEEFYKYSKRTFKNEQDRYDFYFQRYSEWIESLLYDFNLSCERMLSQYDSFDWTRCINAAPNNLVKLIVETV